MLSFSFCCEEDGKKKLCSTEDCLVMALIQMCFCQFVNVTQMNHRGQETFCSFISRTVTHKLKEWSHEDPQDAQQKLLV